MPITPATAELFAEKFTDKEPDLMEIDAELRSATGYRFARRTDDPKNVELHGFLGMDHLIDADGKPQWRVQVFLYTDDFPPEIGHHQTSLKKPSKTGLKPKVDGVIDKV